MPTKALLAMMVRTIRIMIAEPTKANMAKAEEILNLVEQLPKRKPRTRKPKKSGMSDAEQIKMAQISYGDY